MQITAELDSQHIEKLQALEKLLKKNTSELISFAIDEIFINSVTKDAYQLMLQSDFIACVAIDDAVPNEQTKAAMLDVRAKKIWKTSRLNNCNMKLRRDENAVMA